MSNVIGVGCVLAAPKHISLVTPRICVSRVTRLIPVSEGGEAAETLKGKNHCPQCEINGDDRSPDCPNKFDYEDVVKAVRYAKQEARAFMCPSCGKTAQHTALNDGEQTIKRHISHMSNSEHHHSESREPVPLFSGKRIDEAFGYIEDGDSSE